MEASRPHHSAAASGDQLRDGRWPTDAAAAGGDTNVSQEAASLLAGWRRSQNLTLKPSFHNA